MPRKKNSSKDQAEKHQRVLRSEEEIQRLMGEVAAAQAAGTTQTQALKDRNIPYNTYNKWTKKFANAVPATASGAKRQRGTRSEQEIRKLLADIGKLRQDGMVIRDTVARAGISVSTYQFWLKKYDTAAVSTKKPAVAVTTGSSEVSLIEKMLRNREEYDEVKRQLATLDAEFEELKENL